MKYFAIISKKVLKYPICQEENCITKNCVQRNDLKKIKYNKKIMDKSLSFFFKKSFLIKNEKFIELKCRFLIKKRII